MVILNQRDARTKWGQLEVLACVAHRDDPIALD